MIARISILLAAALALAACQPPAGSDDTPAEAADTTAAPTAPEGVSELAADDPAAGAILEAANTTLGEQVGSDVAIQPEIIRREGDDWAFVYGPVRRPGGEEIDWFETNFAHQADEGMLDGDTGVVLLNWADGGWRVVEAVVGPTDVPQAGWPAEHHVSPALVGQEGG